MRVDASVYVRLLSCRSGFAVPRAALAVAMTVLATGLVAGPALAGATSTTLTSTRKSSTYGQTVDFTATVTGGGPSGKVLFKDGARALGSGVLTTLGAQSSLAAGNSHTCALTAAGGVRCWGRDFDGQLGDDNEPNASPVPVDVVGLASGVAAIAAGGYHTCSLTESGGVKCWGSNLYGQLGDGSGSLTRPTPVAVAGLSSGVAAIAVGAGHTCALTESGGVTCWGQNFYGQLGIGTSGGYSDTPVDVVGLGSGVAAIAAGGAHTCALTAAGGVTCWGYNNHGQLGDGTPTDRYNPISVTGLANGVAAIAAGFRHTCALTDAGGVQCWGYNFYGQLGDGSPTDSDIPVAVAGLGSGVAAIAAGNTHSCALTATGAALCWGANGYGLIPVAVAGLGSGGAAIAASASHTCALTAAGGVKCWGKNSVGQLGDGHAPADSGTPVAVVDFGPGTALVHSQATVSTAKLNAGTHEITAVYGGDGFNGPSTSPALTQRVKWGATTATISVTPKKPAYNQSVRVEARIKAAAPAAGKPDGKVVVKDGGKKIGKFKLKKGKAGIRLRDLAEGKHTIKVKFRDRNWKPSGAATAVTVSRQSFGNGGQ
jgi:alpha-tubulin suppressor-like RCC1 family protein